VSVTNISIIFISKILISLLKLNTIIIAFGTGQCHLAKSGDLLPRRDAVAHNHRRTQPSNSVLSNDITFLVTRRLIFVRTKILK
jgi:hypothetical protein